MTEKSNQQLTGFDLWKYAEANVEKCVVCGVGINNPYTLQGDRKSRDVDGFYITQTEVQGWGDVEWIHIQCAAKLVRTLTSYMAMHLENAANKGKAPND